MLQINSLDASDPLAVVGDFGPRLHQRVKNYIAIEVDDGDAGKAVSFLRQDSFAVQRQDFRLSENNSLESLLFHLLSAFLSLVEHVVEHDLVVVVGCLHAQ